MGIFKRQKFQDGCFEDLVIMNTGKNNYNEYKKKQNKYSMNNF